MTIGVDERCAVDKKMSIVTVTQNVVARRVQALGKRSSVGVRGQFEIETGEWAPSIAAQAQHSCTSEQEKCSPGTPVLHLLIY